MCCAGCVRVCRYVCMSVYLQKATQQKATMEEQETRTFKYRQSATCTEFDFVHKLLLIFDLILVHLPSCPCAIFESERERERALALYSLSLGFLDGKNALFFECHLLVNSFVFNENIRNNCIYKHLCWLDGICVSIPRSLT